MNTSNACQKIGIIVFKPKQLLLRPSSNELSNSYKCAAFGDTFVCKILHHLKSRVSKAFAFFLIDFGEMFQCSSTQRLQPKHLNLKWEKQVPQRSGLNTLAHPFLQFVLLRNAFQFYALLIEISSTQRLVNYGFCIKICKLQQHAWPPCVYIFPMENWAWEPPDAQLATLIELLLLLFQLS